MTSSNQIVLTITGDLMSVNDDYRCHSFVSHFSILPISRFSSLVHSFEFPRAIISPLAMTLATAETFVYVAVYSLSTKIGYHPLSPIAHCLYCCISCRVCITMDI